MFDLHAGVAYLYGDIDAEAALHVRKAVDAGTLRMLVINSLGGEVEAALSMFDALHGHDIITVATGACYSAAVIPFLATDVRLATPNTRFLLHPLTPVGDLTEANRKLGKDLHLNIAAIIARRTGVPVTEIVEMMHDEKFFGTEEALKLGFVRDPSGKAIAAPTVPDVFVTCAAIAEHLHTIRDWRADKPEHDREHN